MNWTAKLQYVRFRGTERHSPAVALGQLLTQSGRMDRDHFEYVTSISVRKGANADTSFNGVTLMV